MAVKMILLYLIFLNQAKAIRMLKLVFGLQQAKKEQIILLIVYGMEKMKIQKHMKYI